MRYKISRKLLRISLLCINCTKPLTRPCLIMCGHSFCSGCINSELTFCHRCNDLISSVNPINDITMEGIKGLLLSKSNQGEIELREFFTCMVCLGEIGPTRRYPVVYNCGHTLCKSCSDECSRTGRCPACRSDIYFRVPHKTLFGVRTSCTLHQWFKKYNGEK